MGDQSLTQREILPDFDTVWESCREALESFERCDYAITSELEEAFYAYNDNYNVYDQIEFHRYYVMLRRRGGKECWIPASTIKQCTLVLPYYDALMRYRSVLDTIGTSLSHGYKDTEEWAKTAKTNKLADGEYDRSYGICIEYMGDTHPDYSKDETTHATDMFMRFATDYAWWHGAKFATRGDFFYSPILNLMDRAMNSNEITADLISNIASDSAIRIAAKNLPPVNDDEIKGKEENEPEPQDERRRQTGDNIIVYGAPGVGKSWAIEHNMYPDAIRTRVMFHPEYSYFDFVGSYRPTPVYVEDDKTLVGEDRLPSSVPGVPYIDYRFHPGPFTQMVVEAYKHPRVDYCLIIEEINRANASAVFGDMFQLLDRGDDRSSDYAIRPQQELTTYLKSIGCDELAESFRIPSNMSILATMNSADLGVSFLDAAFKRRWNYRYIPIDIGKNASLGTAITYNNTSCSFAEILVGINEKLASLDINEDRRIGPFFVGPQEMAILGSDSALRKIVMYLWDDVFRNNRSVFFTGEPKTLKDIETGIRVADPFGIWEYVMVNRGADRIETTDEDDESTDEGE